METLQEHMQANVGASIPDPVIDGRWHSGKGKLGKISYVGHYLPKGALVRYRHHKQSDECFTWREWGEGQGEYLNPEEYRQRRQEAQAKADQAAAEAEAAGKRLLAILTTIIAESLPASHEHPYIAKKLILSTGARQATKRYQIIPATEDKRAQYITPNDLLIPVYSHTGQLQGIQQITRTGYKLMRGTSKDGLLWVGGGLSTGEVSNRLYIAEGWATGVAIHMRTRNPVIVAFGTGNLLSAGKWAMDQYPDSELVFAADNDAGKVIKVNGQEIENPGKHYAEQAAAVVGGAALLAPVEGGDWCDWHKSQIAETNKPDLL